MNWKKIVTSLEVGGWLTVAAAGSWLYTTPADEHWIERDTLADRLRASEQAMKDSFRPGVNDCPNRMQGYAYTGTVVRESNGYKSVLAVFSREAGGTQGPFSDFMAMGMDVVRTMARSEKPDCNYPVALAGIEARSLALK